jgi:hypothetical protein
MYYRYGYKENPDQEYRRDNYLKNREQLLFNMYHNYKNNIKSIREEEEKNTWDDINEKEQRIL